MRSYVCEVWSYETFFRNFIVNINSYVIWYMSDKPWAQCLHSAPMIRAMLTWTTSTFGIKWQNHTPVEYGLWHRDHFVYAPNQWETMLHCNVASHWQGTYIEWSLMTLPVLKTYRRPNQKFWKTWTLICKFGQANVPMWCMVPKCSQFIPTSYDKSFSC